jgi:hypothetical protein
VLDLNQAEKFFSSFTVRSRQLNRPIPFRLNVSQQAIMEACKKHMARKRRLFVIFLKGRRLGVSTWARMMLQAHLLEKEFADGLILGQQKITARALYEESHNIAKQLPIKKSAWKYTQQEINFWNIPSKLSWQTAGNVIGARGLGFTMLLATEAAYYINADVFPAVFSTVSDDPENVVIVETTPNGKEGPGQAYYELWEASVHGETEYLTIFLPWHEDPDYVRDPILAKDAPRDEYERYLMKDLKLPKERVAFYRITLKSKCGGSLERWRKEYPGSPAEAFTASGDPVFNFEDLNTCEKWSKDTAYKTIELDALTGHRARARENSQGRYAVYEEPEPGAHYFAGVMIGNADKSDDGPPQSDTLAMVVWNGENGILAGRLHIPLREEFAAGSVYAFACYFNRAMVACDDGGGGFGTRIFQELRDRLRYPNQYKWKGRNDKVDPTRSSQSLGFTITDFTRKMLLNTFLTAVRRQEVITSDDAFTEQMSTVQWSNEAWRFEAIANFDEIFYAGAMGWVARDQWHPKKCEAYESMQDEDLMEMKGISYKVSHMSTQGGILTMNLQHHLDEVRRRGEQKEYDEA